MKKYSKPELIITSVESQDIITASIVDANIQLQRTFKNISFKNVNFF